MKPMLACSTQPDLNTLDYPFMASPKLDGIRCLITGGKALSRSLLPLPNLSIRIRLESLNINDVDGEIMVKGDFNDVQSEVMSEDGEPNFHYNVFDVLDNTKPFIERLTFLQEKVRVCEDSIVRVVYQLQVNNADEVALFYDQALKGGYEGIILKKINAPYKYGRSTLKQQWMLKLKPVIDCEATVISFTELMHNNNEAFIGELGQTKRTSHRENQKPGGTLGALVVEMGGKKFKIGSGFTQAQRQYIWNIRNTFRGKLVTFTHLGLTRYGVPRCPIFKSFRDKRDL